MFTGILKSAKREKEGGCHQKKRAKGGIRFLLRALLTRGKPLARPLWKRPPDRRFPCQYPREGRRGEESQSPLKKKGLPKGERQSEASSLRKGRMPFPVEERSALFEKDPQKEGRSPFVMVRRKKTPKENGLPKLEGKRGSSLSLHHFYAVKRRKASLDQKCRCLSFGKKR